MKSHYSIMYITTNTQVGAAKPVRSPGSFIATDFTDF